MSQFLNISLPYDQYHDQDDQDDHDQDDHDDHDQDDHDDHDHDRDGWEIDSKVR